MEIDKYLRTTFSLSTYLTAGKLYKVISTELGGSCHIIVDDNQLAYTRLCSTAHLDGGDWQVLDTVSAGMSGWL